MSEATPPWRTFSSEASEAATTPSEATRLRAIPRWLVPVLAGVGGLGLGAAAVGSLLLALGGLPAAGEASLPPDRSLLVEPNLAGAAAEREGLSELVVDVAGAVARPGLHRLRPGDRVGDAIEAAGGFAPRADLAASAVALNLAQPLEDGAKVLVPELGIDRPSRRTADDDRIDLNRASTTELESLPGIGPVTAGKIIDAREDERFDTVRELRLRGIVGEKVYEDIEGLVRVS